MADDIDDDFDDLEPTGRKFSQEVYAAAKQVRDDMMPEWNGNDEDHDEFVELTPDGQAVVDGAFSVLELYRIAEGAAEAQRVCAPALGDSPLPPLASAQEPLVALKRLRFTIGSAAGGVVGNLLDQAEQAVARHEGMIQAELDVSMQRQVQIEALNQKLAQVRAVIDAERNARAVGGTIVDPAIIDQLYEALQARVAAA
jgi:hypothetical protein